jgi:N-acetylneuraminate synthase
VSSSLTITEIKNTVASIRRIEKSLMNNKKSSIQFNEYRSIFGKSLSVNKDLDKGHILSFEDLEAKKPADYGISAYDFKNIMGKKLAISKTKWDFLNFEDFE